MIEIMQPAEEEVFYEELYPAHFDEATYEGVLDFKWIFLKLPLY